jgi:hypothetical protein
MSVYDCVGGCSYWYTYLFHVSTSELPICTDVGSLAFCRSMTKSMSDVDPTFFRWANHGGFVALILVIRQFFGRASLDSL